MTKKVYAASPYQELLRAVYSFVHRSQTSGSASLGTEASTRNSPVGIFRLWPGLQLLAHSLATSASSLCRQWPPPDEPAYRQP
ncbi:hypothetical protein GGTG_11974 [Gaeumannomyces tritici R3-111a-1]|uniref:Uncharacterized protein n=1 Tax=Gaeumannomyces tritici (strain R3-111a-1) TaxID=644352 RepID=J3PEP3_GAET3|nr:hypothetical protein GGTG_11974 [Gaeumannomyces tritici R3-111a-1]EJT70951.1 hypothetical protein GGTG_11974 [Gaeumannomyces tritici R3-111a-1]